MVNLNIALHRTHNKTIRDMYVYYSKEKTHVLSFA